MLHDGALVAVLGFVAGWHVGRLAGAAARTALVGVGTGLAVGVVAGATSSLLTNVAVVVGVVVVVGAEVLARHRGLAPVWTRPLLVLAAAAVLAWLLGTPGSPACSASRGSNRTPCGTCSPRSSSPRGCGTPWRRMRRPSRQNASRCASRVTSDATARCASAAPSRREHVELARRAIDANLADLSPLAKRASTDEDGAFIEDFCNWQRLPEIERFIRESGVATIAAELMGATTVRLYHDHVLVKEPGTRQRTPWHQDQPYYNIDGRQNVSMWLPVDSVPRETTLEFVAGSHRGEWFMPRSFLDDEAKWFPAGTLAELPDIDARPDEFTIVGWELEPGDAVFFHMLTLHAAGGVAGTNRRRVLSVRFIGDDIVHAPRPWTTSPPFPGLIDELPAGAPMDHPLFPVLWEHGHLAASDR